MAEKQNHALARELADALTQTPMLAVGLASLEYQDAIHILQLAYQVVRARVKKELEEIEK